MTTPTTATHSHPGCKVDLRSLSPFESMEDEFLANVLRRARVHEHARGDVLFREGTENSQVAYLLTGSVEIRRDGRRVSVIQAGSAEARFPLSKGRMHWHEAEVLSRHAQVLVIDAERLDMLLALEQTGSYRVLDLQQAPDPAIAGDDWMVQVLRSPAFANIPPVNIQTMFMRLQRLDVKAGEMIIRQGDEGDFFYVIVKGRCVVTRDPPAGGRPLRLAELEVGASFGEESLISGARRSANVTMVTDGTLMRLDRKDFCRLCSQPVIREFSLEEGRRLAGAGGVWLDVRLPSEVGSGGIPGSFNVPLYMLRLRLEHLPKGRTIVACCDTGRRSSVAAYILAQHGFETGILKGGLSAHGPAILARTAV